MTFGKASHLFSLCILWSCLACFPAQAQQTPLYGESPDKNLLDEGLELEYAKMIEEEMGEVFTECQGFLAASFFSCECIATTYYEIRMKDPRGTKRSEITNELYTRRNNDCIDMDKIATDRYRHCVSTLPMMNAPLQSANKGNLYDERFCECTGKRTAQLYRRKPPMTFSERRVIMEEVSRSCISDHMAGRL